MATTADGIYYPTPGDQISPTPGGMASHWQKTAESIKPVVDAAQGRPWRALQKLGGALVINNTWTPTGGWTGILGDPGNASGISYSNGALTVSESGVYIMYMQGSLYSGAGTYGTGVIRTRFVKGAVAIASGGMLNGVGQQTVSCQFIGQLNSGDVVENSVFQLTGQSLEWQGFAAMNLWFAAMLFPTF